MLPCSTERKKKNRVYVILMYFKILELLKGKEKKNNVSNNIVICKVNIFQNVGEIIVPMDDIVLNIT